MLKKLLIVSLSIFILSCTRDTSRDAPDSEFNYRTDCGVVYNETLENPINRSLGMEGTIEPISGNTVLWSNDGEQFAIKLHGLGPVSGELRTKATRILSDLSQSKGVFYEAQKDCLATNSSGSTFKVGSVLSINGTSYAEELISRGAANVILDSCAGDEVSECMLALEDQASSNIPDDSDLDTSDRVSNFLWKPSSERDGNLVILLDPAGALVFVDGERLIDFGPSNERGTTARANKSGADFGTNIVVQVRDSAGEPILFPDGESSYTIADGASRVEFD